MIIPSETNVEQALLRELTMSTIVDISRPSVRGIIR